MRGDDRYESKPRKVQKRKRVAIEGDDSVEGSAINKKNACPVKTYTSSIFGRGDENVNLDIPAFDEGRKTLDDRNLLLDKSKFSDIGVSPAIVKYFKKKLGIIRMTEIQATCFSRFYGEEKESDLLIQARTGSGKTFAFMVPILDLIIKGSEDLVRKNFKLERASGLLCIVISPTRELAQQLYSVLTNLVNGVSSSKISGNDKVKHWIVTCLLSSGANRKKEKSVLRSGVQILVTTPGRLLDHLKHTKSFKTNTLKWLVLDEGDLLMELNLLENITEIVKILNENFKSFEGNDFYKESQIFPKKCKKVMCSATLTNFSSIVQDKFIKTTESSEKQIDLTVGLSNNSDKQYTLKDSLSCTVKQHVIISPTKQRLVCLIALIRMIFRLSPSYNHLHDQPFQPLQDDFKSPDKIIVFLSTCDSVTHFFNILTHSSDEDPGANRTASPNPTCATLPNARWSSLLNGKIYMLHGGLKPKERGFLFWEFVNSKDVAILFTTDLSCRGLDVPNVVAIVQYDVPIDVKTYVHRIGRTARMGRHGDAWIFLMENEVEYLNLIKANFGGDHFNISQVKPTTLFSELSKNSKNLPFQDNNKDKSGKSMASSIQLHLEKIVTSGERNLILASNAYRSFMRSYASHKYNSIFSVKRLHRGHLAKSFALSYAPSELSNVIKSTISAKNKLKMAMGSSKKKKRLTDYKPVSNAIIRSVSEFSDGLSSSQKSTPSR